MRLAVCGGKGGCGKTTTSLALAGALVEMRQRPVVVDCDRDMPNLHVYADTPDEPGVGAVAEGASLESGCHDARALEGVRVLPGRPGNDVTGALARLSARDVTEPTLLDTPAGASEDVAVPLRFADAAIVVTTPSGTCVRAAVKTAAMARALDSPVAGVVVSRAEAVPDTLPRVLGVPRDRVVAVPPAETPLASDAWHPVRRLGVVLVPNA